MLSLRHLSLTQEKQLHPSASSFPSAPLLYSSNFSLAQLRLDRPRHAMASTKPSAAVVSVLCASSHLLFFSPSTLFGVKDHERGKTFSSSFLSFSLFLSSNIPSTLRISSRVRSPARARSPWGTLLVSEKSFGRGQRRLVFFISRLVIFDANEAKKKKTKRQRRRRPRKGNLLNPLSSSSLPLSLSHSLKQKTDTIKTKLQTQPRPAPGKAPVYSGAMDATRKVKKRERH